MTQSLQPEEISAPKRMLQLISGYWVSQAIAVAARLKLADLLAAEPRTAAELAPLTNTHALSLHRLLRSLASVGIFAEDEQQRFQLTPLAERLRSDIPGSQRAVALMMSDEHYLAWADLLYSIQTGKPAFDHRYGKPVFDYLAEHPDQAQIFDEAMTGVHGAETRGMLEAYDFSGIGTLIDVGGGNGSLLIEVLQQYPSLHGVIFDRADVVERAKTRIKNAHLEDRCRTVAGNFFESVPTGGHAYLLRHIIHDWDDEKSHKILHNCRQAMTSQAKLLLVESVIPPGNDPGFAKLLDLNMLVIPGGMERTEAEYRELYQSAGFRLTRIVPTRTDVSVIEGEPV